MDDRSSPAGASVEATSFEVSPTRLRAFRWGWLGFMVLATSIPYLWAWWSAPAGSHYTWILPPYPEDSLAYRAWSLQAAQGHWLFQLKYTAIPHAPFLFQPFFLACGWLSAWSSGDVGIVLWLVKMAGVACFLHFFYRYCDFLGLQPFQSIVAAILAGAASGVGGMLAEVGNAAHWPVPPADLWVVDINVFWSLLWNPLFPWALAVMIFVVHRIDRGTQTGRAADLWIGGIATGVMGLIHPYSVPFLGAAAIGLAVVRQKARAWTSVARFCVAAAPFIAYPLWLSSVNPLVARHSVLGAMKTPPLISCLLGFGFLLPLASVGLVLNQRRFLREHWTMIAWFVLSLIMAWLPFWYQRKFLFGAQLPLCILAAVSSDWILLTIGTIAMRRRVLAASCLVLLPLLVSTPAYLLRAEAREVRDNAGGAYFIGDDLWAAMHFLKQNAAPQEVVFATYETSRLIPAFAGNTVVWGHWAMSVDGKERAAWLAKLFDARTSATAEERSQEFWNSGIRYFLADGRMQQWLAQTPTAWPRLESEMVFSNRTTAIYRHRNP